MKQAQKDFHYEMFCRDARYIPQLNKYTILVNGKRISDWNTDTLFKKYMEEISGGK